MTCNVGGMERVLRMLVGLTVIVLGLRFRKWWGVFGAIPLVTGLAGFCPAYTMCSTEKSDTPLFSWGLCSSSKGAK